MAANTILLKGRGTRVELVAASTITPGDIVRRNSTNKLARNSVAGTKLPFMVAVENDLVGKGIDDDYSANDYVQAEVLRSGDWAYCFVAASAAAIAIGDQLGLDGAGGVRKLTAFSQLTSGQYTVTPADLVMGVALDALDNSAGGSKARIRVEVV